MSSPPSFLRRRLHPHEPYGLVLTLGLGITLAGLVLFLAVLASLPPDGGPTPFDQRCAEAMRASAAAHPDLVAWARMLTHVGGVAAMVTLGVLGGLVLLFSRQYRLALGWVVASGGGGLLNFTLKTAIDRPRPPVAIRDEAIFETNASFPSGHSMGSAIGFGSLGYVMVLRLLRLRWRLALIAGLVVLVPLIGWTRFYLRAHWFTDVIGGLAIGTSWVALCITALEVSRRRERAARAAAPVAA
jgi:undecaprenyl-diphosphatase